MPEASKTIVIQKIALNLIRPNPKNRAITQEAIDAMADSLAVLGLLNPIKVRPLPDGTFFLFSGHVRRLGALKLGWVDIDCYVSDKSAKDATVEGIWDNRQNRQNWLDDCRDIENLLDEDPNLTLEQLGKLLRASESEVKRAKRLLNCLNPASRALIEQNLKKSLILSRPGWPTQETEDGPVPTKAGKSWELTQAPVYRLTQLGDPDRVFQALQAVIDHQLTEAQVQKLVAWVQAGNPVETFNPHTAPKATPKPKTPKPTVPTAAEPEPITAAQAAPHSPAEKPVAPPGQMSEAEQLTWEAIFGISILSKIKAKIKKGERPTKGEAALLAADKIIHWLGFLIKESFKLLKKAFKAVSNTFTGLLKLLKLLKAEHRAKLVVLFLLIVFSWWYVSKHGVGQTVHGVYSIFFHPSKSTASAPTPQPTIQAVEAAPTAVPTKVVAKAKVKHTPQATISPTMVAQAPTAQPTVKPQGDLISQGADAAKKGAGLIKALGF